MASYYPPGYYPSGYYPSGFYPGEAVVITVQNLGGEKFYNIRFIPAFELMFNEVESTVYVDDQAVGIKTPFKEQEELFLKIDGKEYGLQPYVSPSQYLKQKPELDQIIRDVAKDLGTTDRQVKKELFDELIKSRKKVESIKETVFNDDEEVVMILVALDDI